MTKPTSICLSLNAEPQLARLVRMTAANVATLCSMSVERVEDVRMAAEEAFIYACALCPSSELTINFLASLDVLTIEFALDGAHTKSLPEADPVGVYADLILHAVCDTFTRQENPCVLRLELGADL